MMQKDSMLQQEDFGTINSYRLNRSLYSGLLYRINYDIAFMLRKQYTGQIDKVKTSSMQ